MSDAEATGVVTPIADNVDAAQARLLEQYKSASNMQGLVAAIATQNQLLENAINDVATKRLFFDGAAAGTQLDNIGTLVGLARNGLPDAQYRLLLMGQVLINNTDGTLPQLANILGLIYEGQINLVSPESPGFANDDLAGYVSYCVFGAALPQAYFDLAASIVRKALPAGVALSSISQAQGAAGGTFAMAGPQAWVGGFGDLNNPTVGGTFSTLLYSNPAA